MTSALGWLGDIAQWVGSLFPRLRNIRSTHGAVKFKHGKAVPVRPGLVWYWPITTDLEVVPVARRTMQLAAQVITCADGWPIAVVAIVMYRITDVVAAVAGNYKIRPTIEDRAQSVVFAEASGKDIGIDLAELSRAVKAGCVEDLGRHGVEIEDVKIIQWSRVLPFKRFGDWSHANTDDH